MADHDDDLSLPDDLRPTDPAGYREAWARIEARWEATVARARTFDEADLHRGVDGEWSFIETLRHLSFATATWVARAIHGDPSPWLPLELPWSEAGPLPGVTDDREARPSLDEVLAMRGARQAMVRDLLSGLTEEQLASSVSITAPGWPRFEDGPFRMCVLTVFNEEHLHNLFAERDLDRL